MSFCWCNDNKVSILFYYWFLVLNGESTEIKNRTECNVCGILTYVCLQLPSLLHPRLFRKNNFLDHFPGKNSVVFCYYFFKSVSWNRVLIWRGENVTTTSSIFMQPDATKKMRYNPCSIPDASGDSVLHSLCCWCIRCLYAFEL